MIVGILGLHVIHAPVHDAPLNQEVTALRIEVAPLQCCDLAHAKSEALRHHDHRPVRFWQTRQDRMECVVGQDHWPLTPFGRIFDTNHLDWIPTFVEQLPPCSAFEDDVHHAPDVRFRLGRFVHLFEPTLNCRRPDCPDEVFPPTRLDVQVDVRQIRLPRGVTFRQLFGDVPVTEPAKRHGPEMMHGLFSVEFEENRFDGFSCLSFGLVLIGGPDEESFPCSPSRRCILVVPKLSDVGALRPLLQGQASKLVICS